MSDNAADDQRTLASILDELSATRTAMQEASRRSCELMREAKAAGGSLRQIAIAARYSHQTVANLIERPI